MDDTAKMIFFSLPIFLLLGELYAEPTTLQSIQNPAALSNFNDTSSTRLSLNPRKMFLGVTNLRNKTSFHPNSGLRLVHTRAELGNTKGSRSSQEDRTEKIGSWELENANKNLNGPAIWKIENGEPVLVEDVTDFKFESHKSYIIIETNLSKASPENWKVYYQIGSQSSGTDAGDAASGAVLVGYRVYPTKIKIQREPEGRESRAFKTLFKLDETRRNISAQNLQYDDSNNTTRMFLMEGKDEIRRREVELSLRHAYDEDSCLVFVSDNVYVNCGCYTSDRLRRGARELAIIMAQKRGLGDENIFLIHRRANKSSTKENNENERQEKDDDKLTQFFAEYARVVIPSIMTEQRIIERPDEFTFEEERRVRDGYTFIVEGKKQYLYQILCQTFITEGQEWFNVHVTRIYEDADTGSIMEERMHYNQIPLKHLDTNDCYLIDSNSNVGLFLWMGRESNVNLRMESARRIEQYRENKYGDYKTFITFVDQDDVPFEVTNCENMINALNPQNKEEMKSESIVEAPSAAKKKHEVME